MYMIKEKTKIIYVPSLIDEHKVIETITTDKSNIFCIYDSGHTSFSDSYELGGIKYLPIRADSNLVSSGIITFSAEPLTYGDDIQLHSQIKSYIQKYVTLSEDFSNLLATYIMLTWIYDAFNEVPYIRFQGDYGSGKTRALLVSGSLSYKSFNAGGASTISPIFHILDKFQGTLVLDEADFRFSDETSEIVKILNNGNQRGFPVLRSQMNAQKEFEPRAFNVYGPKIIAMRGSYQDIALESRFLTESMLKGKRAPNVPSQLPSEMKDEAALLSRKLLSYRMEQRFLVFTKPESITLLEDRITQIITPLLCVAPSEEIRECIVRVAMRGAESLSFERGYTFEAQIVSALLGTFEAGYALSIAEIGKTLRAQTGREMDKSITPMQIGRTLRNKLGLALYKTKGVITVCPGQEEIIAKLKERYGE
jgi:hypothetical protein